MSLLDSAQPLLKKVLSAVHAITRELRFSGTDQQHLVSVALLATILEEADGISAALDRRDGTSAFILLRSLLEAFVDLLNIVNDPQYAEFMHAAVLDQQRRILESALERGSNSPFLACLAGSSDAAAHLAWVRSELSQLKARGIEPLSIRKRFERARQLDYYEGPYANLCWHSHNNLNVLEGRHLRHTSEGIEIRIFDWLADDDAQIIVDTTAGIAANSVAAVKGLLESGRSSSLEGVTHALTELRDLWK